MKCCNLLNINRINTGGKFSRFVFVGYKASCSVCAEGDAFFMLNAQ